MRFLFMFSYKHTKIRTSRPQKNIYIRTKIIIGWEKFLCMRLNNTDWKIFVSATASSRTKAFGVTDLHGEPNDKNIV